jgi:hypothetical protein
MPAATKRSRSRGVSASVSAASPSATPSSWSMRENSSTRARLSSPEVALDESSEPQRGGELRLRPQLVGHAAHQRQHTRRQRIGSLAAGSSLGARVACSGMRRCCGGAGAYD